LRKAEVVVVALEAVAAAVAAWEVHLREPVSIAVWVMLRVVPAVTRMMVWVMRRPDPTVVLMTDSTVRDKQVQTCITLTTIYETIRIFRVRCTPTPTICAPDTRQPSRRIRI
jgi:hypothetical protein